MPAALLIVDLFLHAAAGTIGKTAAQSAGIDKIKLRNNNETAQEIAPPFNPTILTSFGLLNGFYAETTSTPILPAGTCEGCTWKLSGVDVFREYISCNMLADCVRPLLKRLL